MLQRLYLFFSIIFFSINLSSCNGGDSSQATLTGTPLQAVTTVVQTIEQLQNGTGGLSPFIALFDPVGVRFAPYYHLVASDLVLTGSAFQSDFILQSPPVKTWGTQDGSGNPLNYDVRGYFSKFVWDFPYHTNATVTLINSMSDFKSQGNTLNNMLTVYPLSQYRIVEYHQSGINPTFGGLDWTSLIVVLKDLGNSEWSLVALVHGSWTI